MNLIDFSRSYILFRVDWSVKPPPTYSHAPPKTLNNARITLECRCEITPASGGPTVTYVLGASCKTERVGVEREIWLQPNGDFCLAASQEEFLILKSWHKNNPGVMRFPESLGPQPERQSGAVEEVWTAFRIHLEPAQGRALESTEAILDAIFQGEPLVARTEYEEGGCHVRIDQPVKTINASERDGIYQTDTGPLILPDLSPERVGNTERLVERFDLAYSAFNAPDWAEFIVNVPTPVGEGLSVNHYSQSRRIEKTRNALYALT